jgi:hypothetical protein
MPAIFKRWKFLIIGGVVLVVLAYTLDPLIEFALKINVNEKSVMGSGKGKRAAIKLAREKVGALKSQQSPKK